MKQSLGKRTEAKLGNLIKVMVASGDEVLGREASKIDIAVEGMDPAEEQNVIGRKEWIESPSAFNRGFD
jgi:hypothetical protein